MINDHEIKYRIIETRTRLEALKKKYPLIEKESDLDAISQKDYCYKLAIRDFNFLLSILSINEKLYKTITGQKCP